MLHSRIAKKLLCSRSNHRYQYNQRTILPMVFMNTESVSILLPDALLFLAVTSSSLMSPPFFARHKRRVTHTFVKRLEFFMLRNSMLTKGRLCNNRIAALQH